MKKRIISRLIILGFVGILAVCMAPFCSGSEEPHAAMEGRFVQQASAEL